MSPRRIPFATAAARLGPNGVSLDIFYWGLANAL